MYGSPHRAATQNKITIYIDIRKATCLVRITNIYRYGFPSIARFQRCYPLVNRTTRHSAMLILLRSSKNSHCIGGRGGGTGSQRSLHVKFPLKRRIPAVLSTCHSDHASQSYDNLSRIGINQPLHRWGDGGTGLQSSLPVWIPLVCTIPAVLSTCQ